MLSHSNLNLFRDNTRAALFPILKEPLRKLDLGFIDTVKGSVIFNLGKGEHTPAIIFFYLFHPAFYISFAVKIM